MASPFQSYTSGIQPVQGIQEAGTNIAQMQMQGWQSLGKSLSEGLQAYNHNQAQSELADQKAQMLGDQAKAYLQMYQGMPEYSSIAEQLSGYVSQLKNVPTMSLSKKLATLSSTETGFNQLGQTHALVDKFNAMKTQKAITEAEREVSPTKMYQKAIDDSANKYDLTKPYAQQEAEFISQLDKWIAAGADINKQDAIAGYRQRIQEGATEFSKTNPLGLKISEQIDAARTMDEFNAGNAEDAGQAAMSADWAINNPIISGVKSVKPADLSEQEKKRLTEIPEQIKSLQVKQATGDYVPEGVTMSALNALGGGLKDELTKEALMNQARRLKLKGQEINAENLAVADNFRNRLVTGLANATVIPQAILQGIAPSLTKAEEDKVNSVFQGIKSKELNQGIKEGSIAPETAISQLEQEKIAIEAKAKNAELVKQAAQETSAKEAQKTSFALPSTTVGTRDVAVQRPQEEIDRDVLDLVSKRIGYVPSNFQAIYRANKPQTVNIGGVPYFQQPNGQYEAVKIPTLSPEEARLQQNSTFGYQDPKTGKTFYETPIKGLDVKIRGTGEFDTPKDATDYRLMLAKYADTIDAMKEVKTLLKEHPYAVKNPLSVPYQQIIQKQAKAISLMKETLGFDRLSDKKLEIIMDRIPKGESWLRRTDQGIIAADGVIKDLYNSIAKTAEARKLDVIVPTSATGTTTGSVREDFNKKRLGIQQ